MSTKTDWPNEIWLQCSGELNKCDYPKCDCEVSWCENKITPYDIRYIKDKRYGKTTDILYNALASIGAEGVIEDKKDE